MRLVEVEGIRWGIEGLVILVNMEGGGEK